MKKTLIPVLVFSIVSSLFMVWFYFASVDIYHQYVNKNTLVYLNSLGEIGNLPASTSMRSHWKVLQMDYLIRFIFMIVAVFVIVKLIYRRGRPGISLSIALALGFVSSISMLLYFLASSDIYNEYVNEKIMQSVNNLDNLANLPVSANCYLEWGLTKIDFILRAIFMLFITVVLLKLILAKEKQLVA